MITNKGTPKIVSRIIFFAALSVFSSLTSAGIYKWVDEQGNVHYSQQPPANTSAQKMKVQHHAPRDVSSYKKPTLKKPGASADNSEKNAATTEPEKKPETRAEKKRRLAACEQARRNLKYMSEVGRIREKDKDGNTVYLSQKQKEAKMKQARELISKHCKK